MNRSDLPPPFTTLHGRVLLWTRMTRNGSGKYSDANCLSGFASMQSRHTASARWERHAERALHARWEAMSHLHSDGRRGELGRKEYRMLLAYLRSIPLVQRRPSHQSSKDEKQSEAIKAE
jgi:hypothetical protein